MPPCPPTGTCLTCPLFQPFRVGEFTTCFPTYLKVNHNRVQHEKAATLLHILKSFFLFSSDTHQTMKRRIATERLSERSLCLFPPPLGHVFQSRVSAIDSRDRQRNLETISPFVRLNYSELSMNGVSRGGFFGAIFAIK